MGTGTSQGVPLIAQPEGSMNLANTRNWRTRCSIHVEMDGYHVQVDAAPEFRLQCLGNNIRQVDLFILTHGHADHVLGMDDLRRFCDLIGGNALPVYSLPAGLERIRQIFPYAIGDKPVSKGYPAFKLNEMPRVLETPGGTIQSIIQPHPPIESLGLIFTEKSSGRKIVYYNDCKSVSPEARELARGADITVLDGLRPHVHPSHMCIPDALEVAADLACPRTFLTHTTFQVDYDAAEAAFPPNVRLAYDSLRIRL